MSGAERAIRWSTVAAVAGVAVVAGWVSYRHAYTVVATHGESGMVTTAYPATVDGLIYSASMVLLDSARRKARPPALARWLLGCRGEHPRRGQVRPARGGGRRLADAGPGRQLRAAHADRPHKHRARAGHLRASGGRRCRGRGNGGLDRSGLATVPAGRFHAGSACPGQGRLCW